MKSISPNPYKIILENVLEAADYLLDPKQDLAADSPSVSHAQLIGARTFARSIKHMIKAGLIAYDEEIKEAIREIKNEQD